MAYNDLTTKDTLSTENSSYGYSNSSELTGMGFTTTESVAEKRFTEHTEYKVAEFINDYHL